MVRFLLSGAVCCGLRQSFRPWHCSTPCAWGWPKWHWERWVKNNLKDDKMIFKMCQVSSFAFEPGVVIHRVAVIQVALLYKSLQPQNLLDKYIAFIYALKPGSGGVDKGATVRGRVLILNFVGSLCDSVIVVHECINVYPHPHIQVHNIDKSPQILVSDGDQAPLSALPELFSSLAHAQVWDERSHFSYIVNGVCICSFGIGSFASMNTLI